MRLFASIALLLGMCCSTAFAQDNSIKFRNITIEDGLSQSSVNCIIQDQYGFIWMGTQDGLNRYDGQQFKVFKNHPNNLQSLSNNFITDLLIDKVGNIWVATQGGLNLMDPIHETFTHFSYSANNTESISSNNITCLAQDKDGNIWVGTKSRGLNKINLKTNVAERFTIKNSEISNNAVTDILVTKDGSVWVSTIDGVNVIVKDQVVKNYYHNSNTLNTLNSNQVHCMEEDSTGVIWFGTNAGISQLTRQDGKDFFSHFTIKDTSSKARLNVNDIYFDKKNNMWIGTSERGLYKHFEDKTGASKFYQFKNIHYEPTSLVSDEVYKVYPDRTGSIWVGTKNGISMFDALKQGFIHLKRNYDSNNSLPDNTIWCIYPEGNDLFWIGTKKGLSRYDRINSTFRNFSFPAANPNRPGSKDVFMFFKDSDDEYWMGTADGLFKVSFSSDYTQISLDSIEYKDAREDETDPIVYHIYEDKRGRFWIGCADGISLYNKETGAYRFFRHDANNNLSLAGNKVRQILRDDKGQIWAASGDGVSLIHEKADSVWFENFRFSPSNSKSLSHNVITSLWQSEPGIIWIGTYGGGINKLKTQTKEFSHYKLEDGLANNAVYGIIGDNDGNLWISTNNGLSKFDPGSESFTNYKKKDGLQSNEFNTGAYAKTISGEIIFGGINGLNFFRAQNININTISPKVAITGFNINGEDIDQGVLLSKNSFELDYHDQSITINFAALHYTNPENNQFKYKLIGVDNDFQYTSSEHRAHYTNLPPGTYTFKVYAANSDGVWSTEPAVMTIVVETPYWKTTWFQVLMIALGIALTYALYWMRVRDIRLQKLRLSTLVEKKTQEVIKQKNQIEKQKELLEKEKDKAEQLLLNILPEETAQELKSKGKASARQYRRVSVMFTDFKGFTSIAEDMKPAELVSRLDAYFVKFDEIVEHFNLEKIKTIGDAYMCAGGVPVRNKENPIHTVLAGLAIQRHMHQLKEKAQSTGEDFWELRIGINTGETVAGVIGTKRFAYDIWGNTVNVASRLEAACEPGKVNISGRTYDFIEPYFDCTYRGKIPAKNKGEIDMYYVNQIKPELSVDGLGIEPNQQFYDYINLHMFSAINYQKAERYIMRLLEKKLSPSLHYHSIAHTKDVTEAAERIALLEGIKGEDLFVLQTAATYHDAGFVEQYDANEPVGARMAEEILPKFGYTEEQIKIISELIHATKIPHSPKNHLEQIICDADLDYLGREDFHEIADKLRLELREHGKINSDKLWDEIQIKFLTQHQYFTKSAIETRQPGKNKHIEDIKARLAEDNYKD